MPTASIPKVKITHGLASVSLSTAIELLSPTCKNLHRIFRTVKLIVEEMEKNKTDFDLKKESIINAGDNRGDTALILSARNGHLDVVKYLVEQGANLNAQNKAGDTALIESAFNGHLAIVKYLVAQGADITLKGEKNKTALAWAEARSQEDVVHYLLGNA